MPTLARGQENTPSILNWFISINGVLTDAYEVGYQIYDITGGLPGTQIFPVTPGNWETVSSGDGHFSVGSYYAYNNSDGNGYTPTITASLGTHRIQWRWKINLGSSYQSDAEDFEVIVESSGSSVDTYISIQDVRDAGVTDETTFPDAMVLSNIELWQAVLERACRQWFIPKTIILNVDGTDSDTLHFGVPIIEIDYIKINNSDDELDTDLYKVYNATTYPDDRRNPRIKLVNSRYCVDIFTAPMGYGSLLFRKGRQNQEIKGTFGFVEDDMSVPKPIQRALLKLVVEKMTKPVYIGDPATTPTPPPPIIGTLLEEWTDGHRLKYGIAGAKITKRSPYLTGITDDQEIIEIIKMYRAPIGCTTPANPTYR